MEHDMAWSAAGLLARLAARPLPRHWADAGLKLYARRRTAQLDRCDVARAQQATLLHLIRRSRFTRFGQDHGFDSIRTLAEYQQRVPLRTYEKFWSEYWQQPFPLLQGVSWPDALPYFALSSGTTSGTTKYVPVSNQILASNRRAALTTLALFRAAHPEARLFTGKGFFLGGSTDLTELSPGVRSGDLSGIVACEVPALLRPYTFPPSEMALLRDWDKKLSLLAERSVREPITAVGGVPSWLLVLFERLLQVSGKRSVADVWPELRVIIHGGTKFDPYRQVFRRLVGSDAVHFYETYAASEGFFAAEDPKTGLLRLVPDLGVFFEFVPVEQLESDAPTRHVATELETGVQYAVVVTTCAGLWSYVLGDTVCFQSRDPPLLRFTGRTCYFLSAFGEHLISEEVEKAVSAAAQSTGAEVVDFHVGPIFPPSPGEAGHHRFLIEFARFPSDSAQFAAELDSAMCRLNEDYAAHRRGNLAMQPPEVCSVERGGFAAWMRSQGKLGGQHKVPRMDNSGQLTKQLTQFFGKKKVPAEYCGEQLT
jgi:hypothetical protein